MNPEYTAYRPKWHRRRMPIFWWLGKLSYRRFITRELTSLAVGYSALLVLAQIWALGRSEAAYERFRQVLASPAAVILHALLLAFLLFHTLTWLHLAPKALALRLGKMRVPDRAILMGHYAAWALASAVVVRFLEGRS